MPITAEFVNLSLNEMTPPFEEKLAILTYRSKFNFAAIAVDLRVGCDESSLLGLAVLYRKWRRGKCALVPLDTIVYQG